MPTTAGSKPHILFRGGRVKVQGWPGPVAVRTGVLTAREFAALDLGLLAEVEEIIADRARRPGRDAAWFAKYRETIREDLTFFVGVLLSDAPKD